MDQINGAHLPYFSTCYSNGPILVLSDSTRYLEDRLIDFLH